LKILIAADMEGITGVVHWNHVDDKHPEYVRFRRLMTGDVNAAVRGAYAGGASEVLVSDGHGSGRNILIEDLDPRAHLNSGTPAPLSMVQGADLGLAAAMFVGYHASSGSAYAILDHTWSDTRVAELRLNERPVGEIGLNGAVLGHFGVSVVMISGDQTACAEGTAYLGSVETAIVKQATGRMAAECLPPAVTSELIAAAAERGVRRVVSSQAPSPLRLEYPVTVGVDFNQSEMADRASLFPGARRRGRTVEATLPDMPEAYRAFRILLALADG
jgi:D-amino peptidase